MKPCKCHWCGQRPLMRLERSQWGLFGVAECRVSCISPMIAVKGDTPDEALEATRRMWDESNKIKEAV